MKYRVWFLYGDETQKDTQHWLIVHANGPLQAAVWASKVIQSMGDEGHVIQKVEEYND